jgi:hypothetical protein
MIFGSRLLFGLVATGRRHDASHVGTRLIDFKTAKVLGLAIPPAGLAQVDEIIR